MAYNNLCVSRGGPDQVSGLHYTSFDLRDFGADLDGSGHDFEWYHDNV